MADVAQAAGVALATVSRALNEPEKVRPATRATVQAAVRKLGYIPDRTAGALASSRSRLVGAMVPTLANSWYAETMEGLAAELGPAGYQLMLAQSSYHPDAEAGLIATFLGRRVDALVLTGTLRDAAARSRLRKLRLPVVETWDLPQRPLDLAVGFSHEGAGAEAARHLLARGRRRIAFLGADEQRSRQRMAGFQRELQAAGLSPAAVQLVSPPSSVETGRELMARLAASAPAADGVFCSNDFLAAGANLWARENGWPVPGRLAIVGFSDLAIAQVCWPPLTTVHVQARDIGRRAGAMLLARLRGEKLARKVADLGFRLVERAST